MRVKFLNKKFYLCKIVLASKSGFDGGRAQSRAQGAGCRAQEINKISSCIGLDLYATPLLIPSHSLD